MGLKSRIEVHEQPFRPPTVASRPLPPKREAPAKGRKIVAGFGTPFQVTATPSYRGPNIPGYVFVASWRVDSTDDQIEKFLEVSERIGNVKSLFHGTPATNIEAICADGLRPGRAHCMFGAGIYMGPPLKAIGYTTNGWRGRHGGRLDGIHYMLEVDAALGNIKVCMNAEKHDLQKLSTTGHHSVGGFANMTASYVGTLRHNEYVVYDPSQVIVNRILEYHYDPVASPQYNFAPAPAVSGTCQVFRDDRPVVLRPEARAFADVITKKVCGNTSYTSVPYKTIGQSRLQMYQTRSQTMWVCKECAERLKLRVGSKVEAVSAGPRGEKVTVRLV